MGIIVKNIMKHTYKKFIFVILAVILALALVLAIFLPYATSSFDYDNTETINNTVTRQYSEGRIKKLQSNIWSSDITFRQFNIIYRPQCIRKTFQGYYAVLMQNDGSYCFAFWNEENKFTSVYRAKEFVSSEVLKQQIIIGETSVSSITSSGSDYFYFPISKMKLTGHICTDGVLVIQYDKDNIAESIQFFPDDELSVSDNFLKNFFPYILPQDRISK